MLQKNIRANQQHGIGSVVVQRFSPRGDIAKAELAPLILGGGVFQAAGDGHQVAVPYGIGAILLYVHQPVHELANLRAGVYTTVDGVSGGQNPLGLLRGVVSGIDGGGSHGRVADGDLVIKGRAQGVHQRGCRRAAVFGKIIGVGVLLCEQNLRRFRVGIVGDLGVEIFVGPPGVILAPQQLVAHVLGDAEDLRGGKAHIQMVAVDAVAHIPHGFRGCDLHFLIIGQHGGAGGNVLLAFRAENGHQNIQNGGLLGFVLLHLPGNSQLTHGIGQQPVVLGRLAEVRQHDAVRPIFLFDVVRQSRRAAEHGCLSGAESLCHNGEL